MYVLNVVIPNAFVMEGSRLNVIQKQIHCMTGISLIKKISQPLICPVHRQEGEREAGGRIRICAAVDPSLSVESPSEWDHANQLCRVFPKCHFH